MSNINTIYIFLSCLSGLLLGLLFGIWIRGIVQSGKHKKFASYRQQKRKDKKEQKELKKEAKRIEKELASKKPAKEESILAKRVGRKESFVGMECDESNIDASEHIKKRMKTQDKKYAYKGKI